LHGATVCSYHLALFLPDFRFLSSLSGTQPFDSELNGEKADHR
jgi:hypothetical protein